MKPSGEGLCSGSKVPEWWSSAKKASCPPPVLRTEDHLLGQVEVVLATIPYWEFAQYRCQDRAGDESIIPQTLRSQRPTRRVPQEGRLGNVDIQTWSLVSIGRNQLDEVLLRYARFVRMIRLVFPALSAPPIDIGCVGIQPARPDRRKPFSSIPAKPITIPG